MPSKTGFSQFLAWEAKGIHIVVRMNQTVRQVVIYNLCNTKKNLILWRTWFQRQYNHIYISKYWKLLFSFLDSCAKHTLLKLFQWEFDARVGSCFSNTILLYPGQCPPRKLTFKQWKRNLSMMECAHNSSIVWDWVEGLWDKIMSSEPAWFPLQDWSQKWKSGVVLGEKDG